MLDFVKSLNFVLFIVFTALYFYQTVYVGVVLLYRPKSLKKKEVKTCRYGFLLAARNESGVIADLIKSIKNQNYPADMIDVFVVADNCTDNTADVSREAGAIVYERFNNEKVGKGYALDYLLKNIANDYPDKDYSGFFVFDADNLLHPDYVMEMNKVFNKGYRIITSYRNSKNFDTNWITSGYSIWFLREAKYINNARMKLHTSCAVSGTGFLVSAEIFKENGGWKHHLLTEDIEFSIDSVLHEETIGYCGTAMFYDEQPTTFAQSWNQRLRWSKGFYQVLGNYGSSLVKGVFASKKPFACYDMLITIFPAVFITLIGLLINLVILFTHLLAPGAADMSIVNETLSSVSSTFVNFYIMIYCLGLLAIITEWKKINASAKDKIKYSFSFPIFMITYLPISIVALFRKVEWTSIKHGVATMAQADAIAQQMQQSTSETK